jgi:hypothetical protein
MRRLARSLPLAPLALLALLASSCRQVAPLPPDALTDVATLDQFRATFNAEAHRPRLLLLLSPT